MSVTIYQIPIDKWQPGQPRPKSLDRFQVVADGNDHAEALRQLVSEVNSEHIDDVNCYLFIDEDKIPVTTSRAYINFKQACDALAIDATATELIDKGKILTREEMLVETGGKIQVAEEYVEYYEPWYRHFKTILNNNVV